MHQSVGAVSVQYMGSHLHESQLDLQYTYCRRDLQYTYFWLRKTHYLCKRSEVAGRPIVADKPMQSHYRCSVHEPCLRIGNTVCGQGRIQKMNLEGANSGGLGD